VFGVQRAPRDKGDHQGNESQPVMGEPCWTASASRQWWIAWTWQAALNAAANAIGGARDKAADALTQLAQHLTGVCRHR
jgi:hypothetical protein